jgi:hypothetical protein
MEKIYKILSEKREGNWSYVRIWPWLTGNINMDFKEIGCKGAEWI